MADEATYHVDLPKREGMVGTVLRGHTMGPIKNGWILYFHNNKSAPSDEHLEQLCIVMTGEGERLVRYLKRGHKPGTFDLLTFSGPPRLDAPVIWAERVLLI